MDDDNLSVTSIERNSLSSKDGMLYTDEYIIDIWNTVADESVLTMLQREGHAEVSIFYIT